MPKNIGEKDELDVLKTLISLRGKTIPCLGLIRSVKDYRGYEFRNINDITKAPSHSKRDVIINEVSYSLKSTRAAPAAIVNHTTREKWIRVCRSLGLSVSLLDEMVDEYWNLRLSNKIGEDIWVSDRRCPFSNTEQRKNYMRKLINYFLFKGTGTKDNKYPAEKLLEIAYPRNTNTWVVLGKDDAFDNLWPRIKFSLRASKGMPSDYLNMKDSVKKEIIAPWVRFCNNKYRGALHIRVGGNK